MQKRVNGGTVVGWFEPEVEIEIVEEPKVEPEKPKKTAAKKKATKAKSE